MAPMELTAMPFPKLEQTPPVTTIKRVPDLEPLEVDLELGLGTIEKEGSNPNAGDHSNIFEARRAFYSAKH